MTKRTPNAAHAQMFRVLRDKAAFFSEEHGLDAAESMEVVLALGAAYAALLDLPEGAFLQLCQFIYRDQRRDVERQQQAKRD